MAPPAPRGGRARRGASPGDPARARRSWTQLAEQRTRLAVKRSFLAAERTLMAWMRTSLSMISFGFTMVKFFEYLEPERRLTVGWFGRSWAPATLGLLAVARLNFPEAPLVPAAVLLFRSSSWPFRSRSCCGWRPTLSSDCSHGRRRRARDQACSRASAIGQRPSG